MPRKPVALPPSTPGDGADITLVGPAKQLYDDVRSKWDLDCVSLRLLRHACESLQAANNAAAIVAKQGMVVSTSNGITRNPAAQLERDHRAASAATLQKLLLSLD